MRKIQAKILVLTQISCQSESNMKSLGGNIWSILFNFTNPKIKWRSLSYVNATHIQYMYTSRNVCILLFGLNLWMTKITVYFVSAACITHSVCITWSLEVEPIRLVKIDDYDASIHTIYSFSVQPITASVSVLYNFVVYEIGWQWIVFSTTTLHLLEYLENSIYIRASG